MRFVVSACLLGCRCKYSGGSNSNQKVKDFLTGKDYIAICPEVEGGLAVPRETAEIFGGDGLQVLQGCAQVLTKSGKDVSGNYRRGGVIAVEKGVEFGAQAAILKERSPSCGIGSIYDGSFSGSVVPGRGVAAAALGAAGFLLFSEEALPEEGLVVDYQEVTATIVAWLQEKISTAGAKGCVFGLSGGIDSAVVAALAQQAYPQDTLAVILPVESSPEDVEDAWIVARHLGLRTLEINLDSVYHSFISAMDTSNSPGDNLAVANVKPRLRMAALYYLAAKSNCLVVGTGNKSEIVTGFFTKHGDAGVDLEPIGGLVKTQVWELARHLQLPEKIILKKPTAGLWTGQTDEDELGFTYHQLDEYILSGTTDPHVAEKIERAILRSRHKQEMPPVCPL
jgi:NAD+ synthase